MKQSFSMENKSSSDSINGTIVFTSVGRPLYAFDLFAVSIPNSFNSVDNWNERVVTDGVSVNYNGQFAADDESMVFVSERNGAAEIFKSENDKVRRIAAVEGSLFLDRPVLKDGILYFVSNHEAADQPFKSQAAVYSSKVTGGGEITRVSPPGVVDYSPAVSESGDWIAVASYGSGPWKGDFHELDTEIVIFRQGSPSERRKICRGGWPSWSGDSAVFFHRKCDNGWWSVFRVNLPVDAETVEEERITPPGVHALTPAASHTGKWIAVATRRHETKFRHIEIFDLETKRFVKVTEYLNPSLHHYNPFVSPNSKSLGFHRFRGESSAREILVHHVERVKSPVSNLRMLRLSGAFPAFSPDGRWIAFNPEFEGNTGVQILDHANKKRYTLIKDRVSFAVAWSPKEIGVLYTSLGPIFDSVHTTVQIARISFDPADLHDDEEIPVKITILTKENTGNNAFQSCSPDGKELVFRSGRSGHKNLYIIDAVVGEEKSLRQLTNGECIDTMPSWSPDGNWIALSSNRHNPKNPDAFSVYMIRPDGTELHRIGVAGPPGSAESDRERINHVCFSPNSEWLLFTANIGGVSAEPVSLPNHFQPYGDIHVCRTDGTDLRRLTHNAYENGTPAWYVGGDEWKLDDVTLDGIWDRLTGKFDEPLWLTC